jgi:hypothetical protein
VNTAVQDLRHLRWGVLEAIKNRLGFTREEARKIFHAFRGGTTPEGLGGAEEPPRNEDDEKKGPEQEKRPERVRAARAVAPDVGKGPDMTRVVRYMDETNQRLDHIEKDLDYVKGQVDRILTKI